MKELNAKDLEKVSGGSGEGKFRYYIEYWDEHGQHQEKTSVEVFDDEGSAADAMILASNEIESRGGYIISMYPIGA